MEQLNHLFNLALQMSLVENFVFSFFLGMCSFLAVSKKVDSAVGLGTAVVFVTAVTTPACWLVSSLFLDPKSSINLLTKFTGESVDLTFLTFICFIAIIAAMVQFVEMVMEKFAPKLYSTLGIFLPLIAVNCAILGSALFILERKLSFVESIVFGASGGAGWLMAIAVFAGCREKLKYNNVPQGMRGLGLSFLVCGLLSFGFMGFQGVDLNTPKGIPKDVYKAHQAAKKSLGASPAPAATPAISATDKGAAQ